jgi:hypothetical protein
VHFLYGLSYPGFRFCIDVDGFAPLAFNDRADFHLDDADILKL